MGLVDVIAIPIFGSPPRAVGGSQEIWERTGVTVHERTKYLYSEGEMREWVPKIQNLAERAVRCKC